MSEIFVFGSNLAGRHGKGAALTARLEYGAVYGVGIGRTGNAYAIPTKDGRPGTPNLRDPKATLPIEKIFVYVKQFIEYAEQHPELQFKLARIGCGLAGYVDEQIAPLFKGAPSNCKFPDEWKPYV